MANNQRFSNEEYAMMHFIYGQAGGNALRARRIYAARFPNRRIPNVRTFLSVHRKLIAEGTFAPSRREGRPKVLQPAEEEMILNYFENHPQNSIREASAVLGIKSSAIWRILKRQGLHPYHFRRTQELLETDFPRRVRFCQVMRGLNQRNPQFVQRILWTDEALFTRSGVFNSHNMHTWAEENPRNNISTHFQHNFGVNVWAGIVGQFLIGPFILPRRLNGESYLQFLENDLNDLLEELPLDIRGNMWYMHDGAPPHSSLTVRRWLHQNFNGMWIGRGQDAPVEWPARCPDLNPMDFYFWGALKSIVYATPVQNDQDLINRIMNASHEIRASVQTLSSVHFNFLKRVNECIRQTGHHFEQLL